MRIYYYLLLRERVRVRDRVRGRMRVLYDVGAGDWCVPVCPSLVCPYCRQRQAPRVGLGLGRRAQVVYFYTVYKCLQSSHTNAPEVCAKHTV